MLEPRLWVLSVRPNSSRWWLRWPLAWMGRELLLLLPLLPLLLVLPLLPVLRVEEPMRLVLLPW